MPNEKKKRGRAGRTQSSGRQRQPQPSGRQPQNVRTNRDGHRQPEQFEAPSAGQNRGAQTPFLARMNEEYAQARANATSDDDIVATRLYRAERQNTFEVDSDGRPLWNDMLARIARWRVFVRENTDIPPYEAELLAGDIQYDEERIRQELQEEQNRRAEQTQANAPSNRSRANSSAQSSADSSDGGVPLPKT